MFTNLVRSLRRRAVSRTQRAPRLGIHELECRVVPSFDQGFDPVAAGEITLSTSVAYYNYTSEAAQTFQVGMTGTLTEVDMYMSRFSGTVGDLIVDIRGTQANGLPTTGAGQVLLTKTIPAASVPPNPAAFFAIDMSSYNFHVTTGDQLAVVIHVAPATGADVTYWWGGRTDDQYPNGMSAVRDNGTPGWINYDPGQDFGFKTWVDAVTSQPPVVTLPGGPVAYTENGPATPLFSSATVTDSDSPDFDTGTLTVSFASNGTADDRLAIRNEGTGTGQIGVSGSTVTYEGTTIGTFSGGTGTTPLTVALNANSTPTATQALVENLTYSNVSDNPSTADRSVRVVLTDGDGGTSSPSTMTVTVQATNDPPAVAVNAGLTVDQGTTAAITQGDLETTDPDNTPSQLTYTLNGPPAHGKVLRSGLPTTTFTQADINNGLIAYQEDGSATASDNFKFTVSDGALATVQTTFTITVNSTDAPPSVTTNVGLTVGEGGSGVVTQGDLEATDPDNSPAQLTYTVSAGPNHGTLLLNGSPATTFTQADINAGSVSYTNDGSESPTDAFTFTVSDGQLSTSTTTFAITVSQVNDPPTVMTNAGLVVARGSSTAIGHAALDTADPDTPSSQLMYTVAASPAHGTLQESSQTVSTFSQADLDAGRIIYVNDGSSATIDSFAFTVSDGTNTTSSATFAITVDTVPQVTLAPADTASFAGSPVTLTAAATGVPAPTVQWQVKTPGGSFTDIRGATSATCTLIPSAGADGNQYQAVFTNPVGSVTTSAATLTIKPGLTILTEPASLTVPLGQTATFSSGATGSTKVGMQWQVSIDGGATYTNIPGATKATFSVTKVSAAQDGSLYRALFRNAAGTAPSAPATLTVNYTVTLAGKRSITAPPGTAVTLAVQSKTSPTAVQWQMSPDQGHSWANIGGALGVTYSFVTTTAASGRQFRAAVTTGSKTTMSPAATLTVVDPPLLTSSPIDQTAAVGQPAMFTAGAVGAGVKVQWQMSTDGGKTFTIIRGATQGVLTLKTVTAAMNGCVFRAVFIDPVGVTESATATLTVA